MAKKKEILAKDLSTEERIKAAAKKLFTQKGFAATRTRDIAEEAGINLALLNYYFRSKSKLFELVMYENLSLFIGVMVENLKNSPYSFDNQLDFIVDKYIDMLLENPDLPFFVLNLLQSGHFESEHMDNPVFKGITELRNSFLETILKDMELGKVKKMHPLHIIANMMGLIIFPFIASTVLMSRSGNISRKEFEDLMRERKKLIPEWIREMMRV